jgi:hypothetical protein
VRPEAQPPASKSPGLVPFVGWSIAAQHFREFAAEHATRRGTSVLLLGTTGVGKKTMARVWRHLGGLNLGRWHVVVDLGGYAGRVNASVSVN